MIYTEENIRYCLLAWDHYEELEDNLNSKKKLPISGLYNWATVFNGKRTFPQSDQDLAQFNLFHINVTLKNLFLIPTFLKKMPSTAKLILNIDFAVELWQETLGLYPDLLFDIIDRADYIFAVEPLQAEIISYSINRNVPVLPHPVAISEIKKHISEERINQIGFSLHRYDKNFLLSGLIANRLPKTYQSIALGSTSSKRDLLHLFTFIKEYCSFEELIKLTSQLYAVCESYTIHSYGRYTVECAALGVPCVGPENVASIKHCFPDLTTKLNHIKEYSDLLHKLINDKDFYSEVAMKSIKLSEDYSFESSKTKMLNFLNSESH